MSVPRPQATCGAPHPEKIEITCVQKLRVNGAHHGWHRNASGGVAWPQQSSSRSRAGLVEVLVPALDQLVEDLTEMHDRTAVDLDSWPAAKTLVQAWKPDWTPVGGWET